jgi:hypothetical protein
MTPARVPVPRVRAAMRRASATSSVRMWPAIDQPTIRLEQASSTPAR